MNPASSQYEIDDCLDINYQPERFIEASEENQGWIEAGRIQFRTIAPEQVVIPQESRAITPVEFAFRIRNASSASHRFLVFTLIPAMWDAAGQVIERSYAINARRNPIEPDFCFLQPGETFDFAIKGEFYWDEKQLCLRVYESSGGGWRFAMSKGEYWLAVIYKQRRWNLKPENCDDKAWMLIGEIWEGFVVTPAEKFAIIYAKT